jgi:hypothetical protein
MKTEKEELMTDKATPTNTTGQLPQSYLPQQEEKTSQKKRYHSSAAYAAGLTRSAVQHAKPAIHRGLDL